MHVAYQQQARPREVALKLNSPQGRLYSRNPCSSAKTAIDPNPNSANAKASEKQIAEQRPRRRPAQKLVYSLAAISPKFSSRSVYTTLSELQFGYRLALSGVTDSVSTHWPYQRLPLFELSEATAKWKPIVPN